MTKRSETETACRDGVKHIIRPIQFPSREGCSWNADLSSSNGEGSDFFIEKNYVYNHNFYMNPYNKKLKNLARANRHSRNLSEALLWNELKQSKLGVRFTKQKIIGNYIADFYCIEKNMVIEIDGWSHDNKYEHDKERDEYMKALGIHVLRISDKDVKQDMNNVLTFIKHNIDLIK